MKTAYLGLGTNLRSRYGSRTQNLAEAIRRLASDRVKVVRASRVWETAPRDVLDQPRFLNQVIQIETDLLPMRLLRYVKRIEREMGRDHEKARLAPKGPRVIDLDVLLYGSPSVSTVMSSPELTIPHAAMQERKFVLGPLAELAPELRHPVLRRTMRELLAQVADQEGHPIGLEG